MEIQSLKEDSTNMEKHIAPKVFCFISFLLLFAILSTLNLFLGMYEIFQELRLFGTPEDPKIMAGEISKAIASSLSILFLALPGWLCAMGVLLFSQYRPLFYKIVWLVCGAVLIFNIPFGSLLGIVLLFTLYFKREKKHA